MAHVINSRALTGEKPCIYNGNSRAVNARLRNFQYDRTGATDLLPLRNVYCPALEGPWKLRSRDIGEKAKQKKNARNNAKCSKRFQFFMQ